MKKAIYKYENKINHKIYIGQTNNPERRFNEHMYGQSYSTSLLERAIKKYGIENFIFTVIEWAENYDEREKYWIEYYNSYKPYGYNICEGGGYLPNLQKENHPQHTISEETARAIQADLQNFELSMPFIVKKYKTTYTVVENIKSGHTWNYYNLTYPLRPNESILKTKKALKVIDLLKNTNLSYKEIGKIVGWGGSQVGMINTGKNHHQSNIDYPIRKNPKNYDDKIDKCIELLYQNKTNKEIASILQTSPQWVSKINNGTAHYNSNLQYPIRK